MHLSIGVDDGVDGDDDDELLEWSAIVLRMNENVVDVRDRDVDETSHVVLQLLIRLDADYSY